MATQLFANNASALLAASIDDNDLTIQVASGFGVLFPNPGAGEYFLVTLENADGDIETVKIESRSTDLLTVATGGRGQEGTVAQSWTNGQTRVECRVTKGTMELFVQNGGDTMLGALDMDENNLIDAQLTGAATKMLAGQIVNVPLRGTVDDASNEILVPTDGSRATAGGAAVLCEGDDISDTVFAVGMVMMWYGALINVPANWQACDGTNGTPDLRDKFVIGAGSAYSLNATGGATAASGNTGVGGDHDHGAATGSTVLDETTMPEHTHRLYAVENAFDSNADGWTSTASMGVPGEDVGPFDYRQANGAGVDLIEPVGGDGAGHDHSISGSGTHTHSLGSISTLPPYHALYFIMFVGP